MATRAARAGGKLPVDEVLAAADQLLDVLIVAHDKGVIHRDLKPENVFLTREGQVKVLDFGIARLRELSTQSQATRDGSTMGTPAFMPPEQARGLWDEVDARADLWAVGATMFALLTGRPVHEGRTTNEVLVAAVTQTAAPLATALPGVPKPVAELVDRALAFDKSERWPNAKAMQTALRHAFRALHGAPISTHPRLVVPATVPNRTLPSAGVSLPPTLASEGTGPAVSSGRTGVPLRQGTGAQLPRAAVIGGAVVAIGALFAFVVVAISVVASNSQTPASAAASAGDALSAVAPAGFEEARATNAADAGRAETGAKKEPAGAPAPVVISVDELPTAPVQKKAPLNARVPAVKPVPKPATTSWKEQRK